MSLSESSLLPCRHLTMASHLLYLFHVIFLLSCTQFLRIYLQFASSVILRMEHSHTKHIHIPEVIKLRSLRTDHILTKWENQMMWKKKNAKKILPNAFICSVFFQFLFCYKENIWCGILCIIFLLVFFVANNDILNSTSHVLFDSLKLSKKINKKYFYDCIHA